MHVVPLFIKAKKPEQLIVLMHSNNKKHGKQFNYQIIYDNKFWFAWYSSDLLDELKQARNNNIKQR